MSIVSSKPLNSLKPKALGTLLWSIALATGLSLAAIGPSSAQVSSAASTASHGAEEVEFDFTWNVPLELSDLSPKAVRVFVACSACKTDCSSGSAPYNEVSSSIQSADLPTSKNGTAKLTMTLVSNAGFEFTEDGKLTRITFNDSHDFDKDVIPSDANFFQCSIAGWTCREDDGTMKTIFYDDLWGEKPDACRRSANHKSGHPLETSHGSIKKN